MLIKRIVCIVYGRVQGVLFRDFVYRNAKKFAIVGEVENMKDGTVKVVAEGEEEKLGEFLEKLKAGPLLARVDKVELEWGEATGVFKNFKITYHGLLDRI